MFGDYQPLPSPWRQKVVFDRTTYGRALIDEPHRSHTSRYQQLIEDVRNDITRFEPFFASAARVIELDRKRSASLKMVSELSPREQADAIARMEENTLIVQWVQQCLERRIASYRWALERLVIQTPDTIAADADRLSSLPTLAGRRGRDRARRDPLPELRLDLSRGPERHHGLEPADLGQLRGHRLPMRRPGTRIAGERALLVGDAAGLIDPMSGDGMYECFVSSKLAAEAIVDLLAGRASTLQAYEAAVDAALGRLHRASMKLKLAFDRWPRASWQVARLSLTWRTAERMLLGELSAPSDQRGIARLPMWVLARLGSTG